MIYTCPVFDELSKITVPLLMIGNQDTTASVAELAPQVQDPGASHNARLRGLVQ